MGIAYVFFDIDETIVMPHTPFIYGMPESDAFLDALGPCERRLLPELGPRMEAAYFGAPETLVDEDLPQLISDLQRSEKHVWALTARTSAADNHMWHNDIVIDYLLKTGVLFSPLPPSVAHLGNDTQVGGIFFSGGVDKGALIAQIVQHPAILIDNTRGKLTKALASNGCLYGIHFTAAHAREHNDTSR